MSDMVSTIVGLFAVAVALVMPFWIENRRRPHLELRVAKPLRRGYGPRHPAKKAVFLGLELVNYPLQGLAGRLMVRATALNCYGHITFHDITDRRNVFDRVMPIRWSESPEPLAMPIELNGMRGSLYDPAAFVLEPRIDVHPGGEEARRLDVAARFDGDEACYGWCNENYLSEPPWRNRKWELAAGSYLFRVTIFTNVGKLERVFRLINEVPQEDFRIESAAPGESVSD